MKATFVFLILTILFLTGCQKLIPLDKTAIYSGIAFDKGNDEKLTATIQFILPKNIKAQSFTSTQNVTSNAIVEGSNILDISRNFSLLSGKKGIWSHLQVIVISEELAKSGISELLEVLERDHEMRGRSYLCISKGKAGDILSEATPNAESIQAFSISDMIEMNVRNAKTIPVNVLRYSVANIENNENSFITGIELIPEEKTTLKAKSRIQLDGTAIFKKDQLVGWFDRTETRGLLWTLGEIKNCIEDIEYPQMGDPVTAEIESSSAKITPIFEDQAVTKIKVQVNCTGGIDQSNPNFDLFKLGEIPKIEKKAEEKIESEILQAIKKAQEYHADIIGFNTAVNIKNPKLYDTLKGNWDEVFSSLEVEADVKLTLKTTGLKKK